LVIAYVIIALQAFNSAMATAQITKAMDIKLIAAPAGSVLPYKLEITDKHVLSEDEKKTQECVPSSLALKG
jgi:hypothetical protein